MKIERATTEHAEALTNIAFAAKRHWNYPESWIAGWTQLLTITPEYIATNEVYAAFSGTLPIGFYAMVVTPDTADLDHLWVHPRFIGTGVGRQLFEHAVRTAREAEITRFTIESDPNAEGFYRRMGAVAIGQTVTEIEGQKRFLPIYLFTIPADDQSRASG